MKIKDKLKYIIPKMFSWVDDETYLKIKYRIKVGKKLNLDNPQTYNEKLQWLKLHDRKDIYTTMVDKYAVKEYVANIIGEEYIIPTLGVWNNFDEIDFDKLPNQFVLKCTHDSGGLVIVRDKSNFDKKSAKKKLETSLKHNYYLSGREYPYKDVKPRIIAEKYINEKNKEVPEDYKVYCFNGMPKYIVVFHNRFNVNELLCESVYDIQWQKKKFSFDEHFPISKFSIEKPSCLSDMLICAEKLSKNLAQSRIDFYCVNNQLYFGEITLYSAGGFAKMIPEKMDEKFGALIELSKK